MWQLVDTASVLRPKELPNRVDQGLPVSTVTSRSYTKQTWTHNTSCFVMICNRRCLPFDSTVWELLRQLKVEIQFTDADFNFSRVANPGSGCIVYNYTVRKQECQAADKQVTFTCRLSVSSLSMFDYSSKNISVILTQKGEPLLLTFFSFLSFQTVWLERVF